ncbi:MAG TPA: ABC-F family ATP-binding cassette domain-containing protein [Caulobacteraceae bacterium]|nr:ABC-F family ATP-binding cassette domain-containing protein [Caulobacteraceae bacterium]
MARQAVLGMEDGAFGYGARRVFDGLSFMLDDARAGLVGENGAGKSTLLKCLTGELELNRGQLVRSRGLRVGWLPQEVPAELAPLSVRAVLERSLRRAGAAAEDWRIDALLDEVELPPEAAAGLFGALSGGWQRLVLIAAAARLEEPDILVLDEPTNHLDLGNINVLEAWLTERFQLPMLIVSHDRAFLDRVTERTLFLRSDGLTQFSVPFSEARSELIKRDLAAARQRALEEKEIRRLEAVAARYKVWAVKNPDLNKRAKAAESRIAHIRRAQTQAWKARRRDLKLSGDRTEAKVTLRIEGLTLAAPDGRRLFSVDRLALSPGDRIALLGSNGAGKTTLLGAIAAAFDPALEHYDGTAAIRFNPACRLAVFDQTMSGLPLEETPAGYLAAAKTATDQDAARLLAQAGFPYARRREPIAALSPGERARLMFLRMQLERPNLYLLDEPTSHLDIEGQEALEAQLEEREVSCILVSHDRHFTRTAATRFLEIRGGRLVEIDDPEGFYEAQR